MNSQVVSDAALFSRIRTWRDFRTTAEHLFPTDAALRWFIRTNEQALVASGALLKLPRGTYVDPIPFSAPAINLMRGGMPVALDERSRHAPHSRDADLRP